MSVINQMLKDLESRQQQHQVTNLESAAPARLPQQPKSRVWLWVLLLVVILAGTGATFYLWLQLQAGSPNKQDVRQQSQVQPSEPQPVVNKGKPTVTGLAQTDEQVLTQTGEDVEQSSRTATPVRDSSQSESAVASEALTEAGTETVTAQQSRVSVAAEPPARDEAAASASVNTKDQQTVEPQVKPEPRVKASRSVQSAAVNTDKGSDKQAGQMAVTPVPMSPAELAQKRYELGDKAQQNGDFERAKSEYIRALEYNPGLHRAREHLAAVFYGEGELDQAASTLIQGLDAFPEYQNYRLLLARVYQSAGQLQQAYDNAILMQASGVQAIEKWALIGDLAQGLNRNDLSEQAYDRLLALQPGQSRWLMAKAYAVDLQGRYAEAAGIYRNALAAGGLSDSATTFVQQRLEQLGAVE
ncbi:tetratricopeptide repeat protein [Shewanella submarina]|uniref:Tetratricopeptide repeat protein n=1 Tax=Shewanella submarina TaxID=2016376 RepID=A0ABV7GI99_9GAMM|nr:tetratricopeptide repeat protein [Shewanella submarina]MCL1035611.1 tetratricopeptide repeat protein [Shewanella submarina]